MQKTVVPVFIKGLDGKTPPGLRAIGTLDRCENFVIEKGGELGLQLRPRYGTQSLAATVDTGSLATARKLKSYADELLLLTDDRLFSRSVGADKWLDRGACPSLTLTTTADVANTAQQTTADAAYSNGFRVLAWEDSRGGVRYSVIDHETGQAVVNDAVVDASGTLPRVIVAGASVLLFYVVGSALRVRRIILSTPQTLGSASTIGTLAGSPAWHDEVRIENDRVAFMYRSAAGTYTVGFINSMLTVSAAPLPVSIAATVDLAVFVQASSFAAYATEIPLLTYTSGGALSLVRLDRIGLIVLGTHTLDAAPGTTRNVCGYIDGSTTTALYENSAASAINAVTKKAIWTGSASLSTFKRSVGLASVPFLLGGRWHVVCAYGSSIQPTGLVLDVATGGVVGRFHPEIAGGLTAKSTLPNVTAPADGEVLFAALRRTGLETAGGVLLTPTGINTVVVKTGDHALGSPEEFAGGVVVPSACPRFYDGATVVEAGFHLYPETPAAPLQSGGGSLTVLAAYAYMFQWEWTDRRGQRHRSTLSPIVNVTMTGANNRNTFDVPTDRLTGKSNVVLTVWRTEGNKLAWWRASSVTVPVFNDGTVDTIAYVDSLADTALAAGEPLLTTLDPLPPPASRVAMTWKGRCWVGGAEDTDFVYPSLELAPGYGPTWSDALKIRIGSDGGTVTAMIGFDDVALFFKATSVWYVTGEGPDANGSGSFWSVPLRLPSAVGTIDPDSVIRVPAGVMFKSTKGWYLITRSLEVQYMAAADDFAGLTVTGAVVDDTSDLVRFTSAGGTTVCYDVTFGKFLVHTNQRAVAATKWQGAFCYLDAAGVVHQEVSGTYGDDGAFVEAIAEFSFASLAGWLGRGRCFRIQAQGEYRGKHGLRIALVYDHGQVEPEDFNIDVDSALGVTAYGAATPYGSESPYGGWDGAYRFEVKPGVQRMTALKVRVSTYSPTGAATGALAFAGLGFEVGAKAGLSKMPVSRRGAPT